MRIRSRYDLIEARLPRTSKWLVLSIRRCGRRIRMAQTSDQFLPQGRTGAQHRPVSGGAGRGVAR
jgi:hypothetical protein